ncbi:hypothetical protein AV530_005135 [Patagioenas fasciata monilis]|uniref:Uncharacterized protein n=1 Tax=Patagioenas fasciata monilis TaxID=372326 RepID=A0A1V4K436_PATFA|nr:hypothetical protein AV530_005135 [Patagioenas fasciata monilis]
MYVELISLTVPTVCHLNGDYCLQMIRDKTSPCGAVVGSKSKKPKCYTLLHRQRLAAAAGPPLLPSALWDCSPGCTRSCPGPALLSLSSAHLPLLSSPLTMLLEMLQDTQASLLQFN